MNLLATAQIGSDVLQWSLIIGFVLPIVVAAVQQPRFSPGVRAAIGFAVAFIAALGTVYFEGNLDTSNIDTLISSFLLILTVSIANYKGIWKPTNVAPAVEHATSRTPPPTPPARAGRP